MNGQKNLFDMTITELIAAGFKPRVISVVKKKNEEAVTRESVVAAFLGRAVRSVSAQKEFADVEFSRESRRGRLVKTTRNMPLGMVPRGLLATYQAAAHGNPCQRKKPGIRTRFM